MNPSLRPSASSVLKKSVFCLLFSVLCSSVFAQTNVFPASGNVGIGTTTPTKKLSVQGDGIFADGTRGAWVSNDGSNGGRSFLVLDVDSQDGVGVGSDYIYLAQEVSRGILVSAIGTPLELGSGGTHVSISPSGNVGIGSIAPTYKLTLRGAGNSAQAAIAIQDTDNADKEWRVDQYGGAFRIVESGIAVRMQFTPAGNVGIGTTSPGAKLDVGGATGSQYGTVSIKQSAGGQKGIWLQAFENNNALAFFHTGSLGVITTDYTISGSHVPLALQTTGGNVGIGTTSPTHKLSVNGTVRAKEVIVDTGWADHVFKPGYKLASLSEVEGAIKREGHLPGIPSAAEVAEHGVSMGEMQAKLLAKVEELTLHLIAQQKEMKAMQTAHKTEIASLRQQLSGLQTAQP